MEPAELIGRLKAKDAEAQGLYWQTFGGRTYPICLRILGKGPDATDTAVDLLTDFMERRIHALKEPEAIFAYLRLAAVRRSGGTHTLYWISTSRQRRIEPRKPTPIRPG